MDKHDALENFIQIGVSVELAEFSPLVMDTILLSKDNSHMIVNINVLRRPAKVIPKLISDIINKLETVFNMKCIEKHHHSKMAFSLHFKIEDLNEFITLLKIKGVESSSNINLEFTSTLPTNPNNNTMYFIPEA